MVLSNAPNGDIRIVEPPTASAIPQIRVSPGLEEIFSTAMLFEALNGYSVVFSGAIFKTIVPKLFGRNALHTEVRFLKVDSLDALIKCEGKDDVVYVFC